MWNLQRKLSFDYQGFAVILESKSNLFIFSKMIILCKETLPLPTFITLLWSFYLKWYFWDQCQLFISYAVGIIMAATTMWFDIKKALRGKNLVYGFRFTGQPLVKSVWLEII